MNNITLNNEIGKRLETVLMRNYRYFNRDMQTCSLTSALWEIKIKIMGRYHFTFIMIVTAITPKVLASVYRKDNLYIFTTAM